ncbi:hypothetical protein [Henriciella pelagia]|uniref:hypothetical protein n=1 Tax=Henriciella pelagia TaxID=1977912 RepID=UPI001301D208|nr:hypothetical protein [Henriciella pelagia]
MIRSTTTLFLAAGLVACLSDRAPMRSEREFCDVFESWVDTGPRGPDLSRQITFFRPKREENPTVVVLTSLGIDGGCGEGDCLDIADDALVDAAFTMAHGYRIDDYFGLGAYCIGRSPPDFDFTETTGPVSVESRFAGAQVSVTWQKADCPEAADLFEGCTTLDVTY